MQRDCFWRPGIHRGESKVRQDSPAGEMAPRVRRRCSNGLRYDAGRQGTQKTNRMVCRLRAPPRYDIATFNHQRNRYVAVHSAWIGHYHEECDATRVLINNYRGIKASCENSFRSKHPSHASLCVGQAHHVTLGEDMDHVGRLESANLDPHHPDICTGPAEEQRMGAVSESAFVTDIER